jgi:hypothetical protein
MGLPTKKIELLIINDIESTNTRIVHHQNDNLYSRYR